MLRKIAIFLVIGVLILGLDLTFSKFKDDKLIYITEEEIYSLMNSWALQVGRNPNPDEAKAVIDNLIEEEILYREALRLGLDANDQIIKRRLAQKLMFLKQESKGTKLTELEISEFYKNNLDKYLIPAQYDFTHIYFSKEDEGSTRAQNAKALLDKSQEIKGDVFFLGKNFTNKLWNALRLVDGWDTDLQIKQPKVNELAINWYRNKFNNTLESIDGNFENYRISDVLMSSYKLIWDDFCSWLLEILKPEYGQKIDQKSKSELIELFIKNLKIIHPFMPFLSEEIYHNLNDKVSQPITISSWPSKEEYDMQLINSFEITKEIISQIRNYRKEKNIPFKTSIKLYYIPTNKSIDNIDVIKKIGFIEDIIESVKSDFGLVKSFIIKNYEFFIPLDEGFDKDSEIKKLNKELEYNIGFLKSVDSKLKNKNFISNAPKEIIDKEKQKIIDTEQKIKSIKKSISELS